MKITIEDYALRLAGGHEPELAVNSSIRFDLDGYFITVKIDKESGGISCYKSHGINDAFLITPISTNKIIIT